MAFVNLQVFFLSFPWPIDNSKGSAISSVLHGKQVIYSNYLNLWTNNALGPIEIMFKVHIDVYTCN